MAAAAAVAAAYHLFLQDKTVKFARKSFKVIFSKKKILKSFFSFVKTLDDDDGLVFEERGLRIERLKFRSHFSLGMLCSIL